MTRKKKTGNNSIDYGNAEFEEMYQGLDTGHAGTNKKMACYKMFIRMKKKYDVNHKPIVPKPECKTIYVKA